MNRCLRARSGTHSGFLSPPAPRGVNGSGQSLQRAFKSRVIFKPLSDFDPSMLKAGASPAFLFVCRWPAPRRRPATAAGGLGYFLVKFGRTPAAEIFSFRFGCCGSAASELGCRDALAHLAGL